MSEQLLISINERLGDVLGDIGEIKARLNEGSKKHAEFSESLKTVDERTDKLDRDMEHVVKPVVKMVGEHDATLKKHGQIIGKFAAVMGIASAVMFGAFNLIWYAVTHSWESIVGLLRGKGLS